MDICNIFGNTALETKRNIYEKYGCNTLDILQQMYEEQREHNYSELTPMYLKVIINY